MLGLGARTPRPAPAMASDYSRVEVRGGKDHTPALDGRRWLTASGRGSDSRGFRTAGRSSPAAPPKVSTMGPNSSAKPAPMMTVSRPAHGRAPAIHPVHRSMSPSAASGTGFPAATKTWTTEQTRPKLSTRCHLTEQGYLLTPTTKSCEGSVTPAPPERLRLVAIVDGAETETPLEATRCHPSGEDATVIGHVKDDPPMLVLLKTEFGTRIVDVLIGDPLPRICRSQGSIGQHDRPPGSRGRLSPPRRHAPR